MVDGQRLVCMTCQGRDMTTLLESYVSSLVDNKKNKKKEPRRSSVANKGKKGVGLMLSKVSGSSSDISVSPSPIDSPGKRAFISEFKSDRMSSPRIVEK